jgi:hypothetical protein
MYIIKVSSSYLTLQYEVNVIHDTGMYNSTNNLFENLAFALSVTKK